MTSVPPEPTPDTLALRARQATRALRKRLDPLDTRGWMTGLERGFQLGDALLSLAWRHPVLGPRYRRIIITQVVVALAMAAGMVALGLELGSDLWDLFADEDLPGGQVGRLVGASYAALLVIQTVVVALSFDFHDVLTREVSLLAGLEPEDPPLRPRVRFDLRWIIKRLKRRFRAFRVMLPGFVLLSPLAPFVPGGAFAALSSLWAAYWWLVFSFAKSARAWPEPVPQEPWFLRGWDALARHLPLLRRKPFAWWRRFAARSTTSVWAPVAWSERLFGEGLALAGLRALAALPLLGMAVRPLVPVCAALLIARGELALDDVRLAMGLPPAQADAVAPRDPLLP